MSLFFFLSRLHPDAYHQQAIMTQYCILVVLVGVMTWLAFKTGPRNARDQACGELSYPLYIHHQNVLILTISLTSGYSYPVLAIGVALSLIASYGLMRLVDPAVNRMRNLIRGKSLEPAKCPPTILAAVELVH